MTSTNNNNNSNQLAFMLIERGNNMQDTSPTDAVEAYYEASIELNRLAENVENPGESRVAELYKEQSDFYKIKAKNLFIESLQRNEGESKALKELERSARLFGNLFNRGFFGPDSTDNKTSTIISDREGVNRTLEERLAALKSDEATSDISTELVLKGRLEALKPSSSALKDRESRITRDLTKLGINVKSYYNDDKTSEHDETDLIIAMAKDAVAIECSNGIEGSQDNIDDYGSESSELGSEDDKSVSDGENSLSFSPNKLIDQVSSLITENQTKRSSEVDPTLDENEVDQLISITKDALILDSNQNIKKEGIDEDKESNEADINVGSDDKSSFTGSSNEANDQITRLITETEASLKTDENVDFFKRTENERKDINVAKEGIDNEVVELPYDHDIERENLSCESSITRSSLKVVISSSIELLREASSVLENDDDLEKVVDILIQAKTIFDVSLQQT